MIDFHGRLKRLKVAKPWCSFGGGHILSFLPTLFAVQTSILSKRWRHLWTCVTSLHFDDELFKDYDDGKDTKRFEHFVDRVLVHLRAPCLQKFHLHCRHVCDPFHVNTWASAALSRDVREFIIDVFLPDSIEIPVSLFTCKTLSYLYLSSPTTLNLPNSVCLPNLKYMHLSAVIFENDESVVKLISGCPALEELEIWPDNVFHLSISSTTLKWLTINFCADFKPDRPPNTLEIDAPLLQCLTLLDCLSIDYVIGNLSSLMTVRFVDTIERNIGEYYHGSKVMELFKALPHLKFLELTGATVKALSDAIEHTPDLTSLPVNEGLVRTSKHDAWSIQPDHAPKFLFPCLTEVDIDDFDGSSSEIMMVKYILKGAKSLESMTIFTSHLQAQLDLHQEMTMFPEILNVVNK